MLFRSTFTLVGKVDAADFLGFGDAPADGLLQGEGLRHVRRVRQGHPALLAGGDWKQLVVQLVIALVAILYSAVITAIIAFALEKTIGWRVTEAQEVGGIDLADQGERAYDFAGTASSVLKEVK